MNNQNKIKEGQHSQKLPVGCRLVRKGISDDTILNFEVISENNKTKCVEDWPINLHTKFGVDISWLILELLDIEILVLASEVKFDLGGQRS